MLRPVAVALLLLGTLLAPTAAATTRPDPDRPQRAAMADAALARVDQLLADPTTGGDVTMALRDLAMLRDALPPAERQRAATYLSRPTANPDRCPDFSCYTTRRVKRVCFSTVCVHYVLRADDAENGVPPRDTDRDGRPDYVEHVLQSVQRVHRTYVAAGYRPPARDGRRGGDARPDIYLAQIGDQSLYGYCTTDQSTLPEHGSTWAYCVLDNDYARSEFPNHTPIQNMQVTAAHEYFHAVQFGYDVGEDAWFMEATATWAEDEVYDRVNDNLSYLSIGPMAHPDRSLDTFRDGYWYGAWIYFRHVTERFGQSDAGLPVIVRRMWRLADAARPDAPDLHSTAAIEQALTEKGSSVATQLLEMAADNLHPRRWYDEGAAYPSTPPDGTFTLTSLLPGKTVTVVQNHLTSASYRFQPGADLAAEDWRLQVTLDLGPAETASQALVRVLLKSGGVRTAVPSLSPEGEATARFAFSASQVAAVEITVANGSTRYDCDQRTGWSCHGRPLDQAVPQSVQVAAVQP